MSGSHRSNRRHAYGSLAYHKRGTSVCGNAVRLPIECVDGAVLSKLGGDVLRPAVVLAVIDGVLEELKFAVVSRDVEGLRDEQRKAIEDSP